MMNTQQIQSFANPTNTTLLHVILTWLAALAMLLAMYTPQVIITMSIQLITILTIVILTLSFLYHHSKTNCNQLSMNLNSRTTILNKFNKPINHYKETLKHNTEV